MSDINDPYGNEYEVIQDQDQIIKPKKEGFAIAGLVLGIVGILGGCCGIFGLVLGVLAITFSVLYLRANKTFRGKKGLAISGLVLGIITIVISIIIIIATPYFEDEAFQEKILDMIEQYEEDGSK